MFQSPWFLLLLPIVVPWIAWRLWVRPTSAAVPFSTTKFAMKLKPTWRQRLAWLPSALTLAAMATMIIALARPREGRQQTIVESDGIAIEMVVDRSGSMRAMDFRIDGQHVDRLSAIKNVAGRFVQGDAASHSHDGLSGRPSDSIGLITFARAADAIMPPTLDHAFVLDQLNHQQVATTRNEDGTAIGDAVSLAIEKLRALDRGKEQKIKSKIVILLTDGDNNAGDVDPIQAAELAQAMGVKIYTIGVGTRGAAPMPVRDVLTGRQHLEWVEVNIDEEALQKMAATTGGKYFRATDTESLAAIYHEIDQLEKSSMESRQFTNYRELAVEAANIGPWFVPPLALLALGLLSARVLLANLVFRELD